MSPSEALETVSMSIWSNRFWCRTRQTVTQRRCITTRWRYGHFFRFPFFSLFLFRRDTAQRRCLKGHSNHHYSHCACLGSAQIWFQVVKQSMTKETFHHWGIFVFILLISWVKLNMWMNIFNIKKLSFHFYITLQYITLWILSRFSCMGFHAVEGDIFYILWQFFWAERSQEKRDRSHLTGKASLHCIVCVVMGTLLVIYKL